MKATIPQTGNAKNGRDDTAELVAKIKQVDVSYVRKIINGKYKPKTEAGKSKAQAIKKAYREIINGKRKLVNEVKKLARA